MFASHLAVAWTELWKGAEAIWRTTGRPVNRF